IEQIVGLLEHGDQHPQERERREADEAHDDHGDDALAQRLSPRPLQPIHQATSVRRARRNIRMAAAASTGSKNSAVAAPPARSPPSIPLKNARLASTWGLSYGPPRVST